jgi:cytochrome c oxidase subunit 3
MNITFLFLAGLAVIISWWLSQQRITAKPWLEAGPVADTGVSSLPAAKIGLGVFLAVVGFLFTLFFSAYFMRMKMVELNMPDWKPLPATKLLWLNTGVLILSSCTLQWAKFAAHRRQLDGIRAGLLATAGLALAFLAGQIIAWRQLTAAGYLLTTSPAYAFVYLIIGVHALHLFGGFVAVGRTTATALGDIAVREVHLSVELCAMYWHFLLLVWLVFFGLLLVTDPTQPDSGLISLICSIF